MLLNGDALLAVDEAGVPFAGSTLLVLINGGAAPAEFVMPRVEWGDTWDVVIDTAATKNDEARGPRSTSGTSCRLAAKSIVVHRLVSRG
jgi:hypothetical protein